MRTQVLGLENEMTQQEAAKADELLLLVGTGRLPIQRRRAVRLAAWKEEAGQSTVELECPPRSISSTKPAWWGT